jgi:hypothetical protein
MSSKEFKCIPFELHSRPTDMMANVFSSHETKIAMELFAGPLKGMRETQKKFVLDILKDLSNPLPFYDPTEKIVDPYADHKYSINGKAPTTLEKIYNLHHGQRKLFLSDMHIIMETIKICGDKIDVVYAGAAPGCHIVHLLKLFPHIRMHLYDPADFDASLKENTSIFLHQEMFTNEVATNWRDRCNAFICDIRVPTATRHEGEIQILEDMHNQAEWTRIINADLSSLKFRPPYINNDDDLKKYKDYSYYGGVVYWGIYPPVQSTEGRLFVTKQSIKNGFVPFDPLHYQDACSQHNVRRVWKNNRTINGLTNVPGYDRCVDCTLEANLWEQYIINHNGTDTIDYYMNWVSSVVHQSLNYVVKKSEDRTSALPGIKLHGIARCMARSYRIMKTLPCWEKCIADPNSDQEKRRSDNIEKGTTIFKEKFIK